MEMGSCFACLAIILNSYHLSGTVVDTEDTVATETDIALPL